MHTEVAVGVNLPADISNSYSQTEKFQDYFGGIWRMGVRISLTSGTIPFFYVEDVNPEVYRLAWKLEKQGEKYANLIGAAMMEIEINGTEPNEFALISPPGIGFVAFDFISPENGWYLVRFLVSEGEALIINSENNLTSWLCNNNQSADFRMYLEKGKMVSFCQKILSGTCKTHMIAFLNDVIPILAPGSAYFSKKQNFTPAVMYQSVPCSNKFEDNVTKFVSSQISKKMGGLIKHTMQDFESRLRNVQPVQTPRLKYLIFFVPRSGSTVLTELLSKSNVAGFPHEYIIPNIYYCLRPLVDGGSGDYIDFLERTFQSKNGIFGMEIDHDRYRTFWEWTLARNLENYKSILVDSKGFVRQIVSQYYMDVYEIGFDCEDQVNEAVEAKLNVQKLLAVIVFLLRHKIGIRKINRGCPNIIYYEDIVDGNFSKKIADALEFDELELAEIKKVESAKNETFFRPSNSSGKKQLKEQVELVLSKLALNAKTYYFENHAIKSIVPIDGMEEIIFEIERMEPGLFSPVIQFVREEISVIHKNKKKHHKRN